MKIKHLTNLTDSQYDTILGIINDKRKRRYSLKDIFDAIFYLLKTGCQWRMLPSDFPKWERVYYYFHKWSCDGTMEEIHEVLRKRLRKKRGREESPSVLIHRVLKPLKSVANEHDSRSGFRVLELIRGRYERMKKICADGGYRGKLIDKVKDTLHCDIEITLRTDKSTTFRPLPKRWVVERAFAWLDDFRRLTKDYERKVTCSENMVYLSFISLMMKWL